LLALLESQSLSYYLLYFIIFEIQNILFPQTIAATTPPITQVMNEEEVQPKIITPLRASNPITLNSPFHIEERPLTTVEQTQPPSHARLYPANGRVRGTTYSKKELNRHRSLSWPGLPKITRKLEKA